MGASLAPNYRISTIPAAGPWFQDPAYRHVVRAAPGQGEVAHIVPGRFEAANGRLILAALPMLAALHALVAAAAPSSQSTTDPSVAAAWKQAREAIARATGAFA